MPLLSLISWQNDMQTKHTPASQKDDLVSLSQGEGYGKLRTRGPRQWTKKKHFTHKACAVNPPFFVSLRDSQRHQHLSKLNLACPHQ